MSAEPASGQHPGTQAQATVSPAGADGRRRAATDRPRADSYYGRPIIAEPVWSWEIPWYFFTGGLGGASAALGFAAGVAGNERLARSAWATALGAVGVSPGLLISDLGRPERFLNMLRMLKVTSPMSVGTWILSASGACTALASSSSLLGWFPRLGKVAKLGAASLGPGLATYTAVLVADTAVPVWHEGRRELPFVFAGSSMASAGAAAAALTPVAQAGPARRLTVAGALLEGAATQLMEHRLGDLAEPFHQGECGRYARPAKALTTVGAAVVGYGGRRSRALAVAGGAAVLAGAALERLTIFKAGFQSARDPKYTVQRQRARLAGATRA